MQFRLDKEGREFHHYDDFCQLYRAEILNLNRILDALVRNGVLPSNFIISSGSVVSLNSLKLLQFINEMIFSNRKKLVMIHAEISLFEIS